MAISTRITKYAREKMARALVKHRFQARASELTNASAALFNQVLDERYDAATQKLMRQLEKRVPKGLKKVDDLYLRARGMRVGVGATHIGYYNIASWTAKVKARPVLDDDGEPSEVLASRIAAFALETKRFSEEVQEAYRKALGTLARFTTAKKLAEEWPEALPVIGHLISIEERTLPVVQLEAINDEFGLPPATQVPA